MENQNKIDNIVMGVMIVMSLVIGGFAGSKMEQDVESTLVQQVYDVKGELRKEMKEVDYWKHRWEKQDTILHRISAHKECTFNIRSIIGDLE